MYLVSVTMMGIQHVFGNQSVWASLYEERPPRAQILSVATWFFICKKKPKKKPVLLYAAAEVWMRCLKM